MECKKVTKLLSEYLEGSLDESTGKLVEEHLKGCEACKAEAASLEAYFKEMRGINEVSPPDNFRQLVYARIESGGKLKKLARVLFIPVRFKVPLELAAAAAAVILVLTIFHFYMPTSGPESYTELAKNEIQPVAKLAQSADDKTAVGDMADIKETKAFSGNEEQMVAMQAPAAEAPLSSSAAEPEVAVEVEPVVVALLIRPGTLPRTEAEGMERRKGTTAWEKDVLEDRDELVEEAPATQPSGQGRRALKYESTPGAKSKPARNKIGRIATSGSQPVEDTPAHSARLEEVFDRLARLVEDMDGEIVAVEKQAEVEPADLITAEIPAENYSRFLEELINLGDIDGQIPDSAAGGNPVRLVIKLILPNDSK